MLCVITVISKPKSCPVFFSSRFKKGSLMPSLSLESGGHVMWVDLQEKTQAKKNRRDEDEDEFTKRSEMEFPVQEHKLTACLFRTLRWLKTLSHHP